VSTGFQQIGQTLSPFPGVLQSLRAQICQANADAGHLQSEVFGSHDLPAARDRDDLEAWAKTADCSDCRDPVLPWHEEVRDDKIDRLLLKQGYALLSVSGRDNVITADL
jgi:hypothetical protein